MDVAMGEYGDVLPQLVSIVENGRLIYNESSAPLRATNSPDTEGSRCPFQFCVWYHTLLIMYPF